ncbi:delta(1)-pyrroline-2-carboxylate reductase family protein [Comamonas resistens]|uniref:Delta(1)-pyrroline-2-carboxylate reductase family protein n=1 Tax=Comamonas resistens TaxID=3046670 RepID=A0ABY8SSY0_9BURK|nr:delta(1)-pyrroline-2-carboxylate reductase family protein [Comamonas resistens]MDL5037574.1 delta(1)-pyrroline-2-carboxylate reductase family protein [Comamonas resistens]WHS64386.1 delta(1)-pyrroline-2-carboxylate reductase family protein [Comamonas resistens]
MTATTTPTSSALDAQATADLLPWTALADEIEELLQQLKNSSSVAVPPRIVMPVGKDGSLFCMPATDGQLAMTKLISFTPGNAGTDRPTIQGDIVVFDVATGQRQLILDGPTVTARRTAAVSLLAARRLAAQPLGPLLIIGAGVQGSAHLQAFAAGLGTREVWVHSRSSASAQKLVEQAQAIGLQARQVSDLAQAARHCPLIVTCTPAQAVVLNEAPHPQAFVCAVGAFTPQMVELAPELCHHFLQHGQIVVDTEDAGHEAGDLLQAGIDIAALPTLAEVVQQNWPRPQAAVLFKSCGWGGWDLAATRLALRQHLAAIDK